MEHLVHAGRFCAAVDRRANGQRAGGEHRRAEYRLTLARPVQ
jgi:hypothetical protein